MIDEHIQNAINRFVEKIQTQPLSKQEIYVGQTPTLLLTFKQEDKNKILEEYYKFPANKLFAIQFL